MRLFKEILFCFKTLAGIRIKHSTIPGPTTPSSPILLTDSPMSGPFERQDPSRPIEPDTQELRAVVELST